MRLMGAGAFAHVFAPWRGAAARLVDGAGNVGDRLLGDAARQLLTEHGVGWRAGLDGDAPADVVFLHAGGNLGAYPPNPGIRAAAVEWARANGAAVVQLPQTALAFEDVGPARVFVRERQSLRHYPAAALAPDLSFGWAAGGPFGPPTSPGGVFARADAEAGRVWLARHPANRGDPAAWAETPAEYLACAARQAVIVTDRLHFAVCGLLAGRAVWLCAGGYWKNRAVFDCWLEGFGCGWCDSPGTLKRIIG